MNSWHAACVFVYAPMPVREALYTISPSADSTLAIELWKTGLMRRKRHTLFFEKFSGNLSYVADQPELSRASLIIDAKSLICRDAWLNARKQKLVTQYAKEEALVTDGHPEVRFSSSRIASKPLRGFIVEGDLTVSDVTRRVKVNVVLSDRKNDTFQIDGDATIRLTDFGIKPPSAMLGLIGTNNEALIRILLWATPVGRARFE